MIVLDEQLAKPEISQAIERWYPGKVVNIKQVRAHTRVEDDVIDVLLHHLKDPTFVTINWSDFWKKVRPHPAFCIVCLKFPSSRVQEVPKVLRDVLRKLPTKRERMGKILLVGRDAFEIDN